MQKQKIKISKAKIIDVPAILEMFREFMDEHGKIVSRGNPKLSPHVKRKKNAAKIFEKYISKNIKSGKSLVNIAEVDGKVAGYSLSYIKDMPPVYAVDKVGHISDIFVREKFRGIGISSLFKDEAFKFFRKKRIRFKTISVYQENKRAHSIYKKWGFFDHHTEMRKN